MQCGENPSRHQQQHVWYQQPRSPRSLPHSEARFELQQVVFSTSPSLNALPCCPLTGWLEINQQVNIVPCKLASELMDGWMNLHTHIERLSRIHSTMTSINASKYLMLKK